MRVCVIGNDSTAPDLNVDRMDSIITIGLNRTWMLYKTDYLFFHDMAVLKEFLLAGNRLSDWNVVCSDWINNCKNKDLLNKHEKILSIYRRPNLRKFPDSASTAIEIFNHYNIGGCAKSTFYLAAMSMRWKENGHFWSGNKSVRNKRGREWYEPRFRMMLKNIKNLKSRGIQMTSVTRSSALNDILRYVPIEELYETNEIRKEQQIRRSSVLRTRRRVNSVGKRRQK